MTDAGISAGFLAVATAVAVALTRRSGVHWGAVALAGLGLVVLTAVFDSLMIGVGLFDYAPALISGIRIGGAPVEDFAYPLAAVVLLPALWSMLTRRDGIRAGELVRQAFIASRPISWINTAFPFAAAVLLTTGSVNWLLVVGTLYYLIPYNAAMYGINDVFDYASDVNNPRKGGIEGALLPPRLHRPLLWLVLALNVPFLIVLLGAGGPATWAAVAVSTFAVIAYSVPGLRFKERPVLDSITSSTHFVSPAIVGLTLVGAPFDTGTTLVLVAFFLWGMAAHAFGAVQDIRPDRDAGIRSIATFFGAKTTVRLALALWTASGLLMLATPWPGPLAAVLVVPYLVNCAPFFRIGDDAAQATNRAWRRFIWINYVTGFFATMIMILAWELAS